MKEARVLRQVQERHFSAHHTLLHAATRANKTAAKREPGWFYENLATMLFSALAMEALCNSIGERVIDKWDDYESASPMAKLRLLAGYLGIKYKSDVEPWATARWLFKFRNLVAHSKPERIVEEHLMTQEEHDKGGLRVPKSKLEKQVTSGNALRALKAAKRIEDLLIDRMPRHEALALAIDSWSGTTTRVDRGA